MAAIDIIVVNWNSGEQLHACVASIVDAAAAIDDNVTITVIDNASSDNSCARLDERYPAVSLIREPHNFGFGAACNRGAARGTAELLLFLNPDVRLFPDTLRQALSIMRSPRAAEIGILGAQLFDDNGVVQRSCAYFPTLGRQLATVLGLDRTGIGAGSGHLMREWDHRQERIVDQVMGAFLLVRRAVFASLGGFDERFFLYFEDVDLALRARRQGWLNLFAPDVKARHRGGGTTDQIKTRRLALFWHSRLLYASLHWSRREARSLYIFTLTAEPLVRIVYHLLTGKTGELRHTIGAWWQLVRSRHRPAW